MLNRIINRSPPNISMVRTRASSLCVLPPLQRGAQPEPARARVIAPALEPRQSGCPRSPVPAGYMTMGRAARLLACGTSGVRCRIQSGRLDAWLLEDGRKVVSGKSVSAYIALRDKLKPPEGAIRLCYAMRSLGYRDSQVSSIWRHHGNGRYFRLEDAQGKTHSFRVYPDAQKFLWIKPGAGRKIRCICEARAALIPLSEAAALLGRRSHGLGSYIRDNLLRPGVAGYRMPDAAVRELHVAKISGELFLVKAEIESLLAALKAIKKTRPAFLAVTAFARAEGIRPSTAFRVLKAKLASGELPPHSIRHIRRRNGFVITLAGPAVQAMLKSYQQCHRKTLLSSIPGHETLRSGIDPALQLIRLSLVREGAGRFSDFYGIAVPARVEAVPGAPSAPGGFRIYLDPPEARLVRFCLDLRRFSPDADRAFRKILKKPPTSLSPQDIAMLWLARFAYLTIPDALCQKLLASTGAGSNALSGSRPSARWFNYLHSLDDNSPLIDLFSQGIPPRYYHPVPEPPE